MGIVDGAMTGAAVSILIVVAVLVAFSRAAARHESLIKQAICALPGFGAASPLVVPDSGIAVEHTSRRVAVAKRTSTELIVKALPFDALLAAEVETTRATHSTTKTAGFGTSNTVSGPDQVSLRVLLSDAQISMLHFPLASMDLAQEWRATLLAAMQQASAPVATPSIANGEQFEQRLRVLADLRNDGVISEDDFQSAKSKILQG